MEAYYFSHMDKHRQAVYQAMLKGVQNLEEEFLVPYSGAGQLYDVFFQMRLDHPEIFWVPAYRYRRYTDSPNAILVPEYLFDKGKVREHQKMMTSRMEKLARPAEMLTEWEKELYIHDFICRNVRYDKLKKPYSHEIIGPLGQGVGVCEGIAKTVKALCDRLGVWCMIPVCGNNPEKGIKYRHTWNILRINGSFVHLDVTFDNTLGKGDPDGLRYDYFNLDDRAVFRDHEPLIAPAPVCENGELFYYRAARLSFTKMEEVQKRTEQAARKGKAITFHWRGGGLNRELLEEILDTARKAGEKKGKRLKASVNLPQAVFHLEYGEYADETVTLEEANEGEQE